MVGCLLERTLINFSSFFDWALIQEGRLFERRCYSRLMYFLHSYVVWKIECWFLDIVDKACYIISIERIFYRDSKYLYVEQQALIWEHYIVFICRPIYAIVLRTPIALWKKTFKNMNITFSIINSLAIVPLKIERSDV